MTHHIQLKTATQSAQSHTHTHTHPHTRTHESKHTLHKEDTHGQNIHKSRVKIGVPPWNGQWQTCRWGFKPV